jgi:hypothetical protein
LAMTKLLRSRTALGAHAVDECRLSAGATRGGSARKQKTRQRRSAPGKTSDHTVLYLIRLDSGNTENIPQTSKPGTGVVGLGGEPAHRALTPFRLRHRLHRALGAGVVVVDHHPRPTNAYPASPPSSTPTARTTCRAWAHCALPASHSCCADRDRARAAPAAPSNPRDRASMPASASAMGRWARACSPPPTRWRPRASPSCSTNSTASARPSRRRCWRKPSSASSS